MIDVDSRFVSSFRESEPCINDGGVRKWGYVEDGCYLSHEQPTAINVGVLRTIIKSLGPLANVALAASIDDARSPYVSTFPLLCLVNRGDKYALITSCSTGILYLNMYDCVVVLDVV